MRVSKWKLVLAISIIVLNIPVRSGVVVVVLGMLLERQAGLQHLQVPCNSPGPGAGAVGTGCSEVTRCLAEDDESQAALGDFCVPYATSSLGMPSLGWLRGHPALPRPPLGACPHQDRMGQPFPCLPNWMQLSRALPRRRLAFPLFVYR